MESFEYINNKLPYNPSDVDFRRQTFTVYQVMSMIRSNKIDLLRELDYQRIGNQWSIEQKGRLIESLLMRIPLPIFYLDGSEDPWKVIDGLQRLTTLFSFFNGEFKLENLEYLKELEGKTLSNISFNYIRVIEESQLECYIINPGTPHKVILNIFQRINTAGKPLTRQEIRNVYYKGKATEFINSLAKEKEFLITTRRRFSKAGMIDREVVLRFFAFFQHYDKYNPPMEKFLDYSMESIEKLNNSQLEMIKNKFLYSMIVCRNIFEDKAFYILNSSGAKKGNLINKALFETWSVNIAKIENNNLITLNDMKSIVFNKFLELLEDTDFRKSVISGTSSKNAVFTRFLKVKDLIDGVLNVNER